jgi:hypothetical protein
MADQIIRIRGPNYASLHIFTQLLLNHCLDTEMSYLSVLTQLTSAIMHKYALQINLNKTGATCGLYKHYSKTLFPSELHIQSVSVM